MSVHGGHLLLFFGLILLVHQCSVEAHACKRRYGSFSQSTPLRKPVQQDSIQEENVPYGSNDLSGNKGTSNNYEFLNNIGLDGFKKQDEEVESRRATPLNRLRSMDGQGGLKKEEVKLTKEPESQETKNSEAKDEYKEEYVTDEEKEGEDSNDSTTSAVSSGRQVMRGKYLHVSNRGGVRFTVLSPAKVQQVVVKRGTVTVNGRVVCDDIRKLRKRQTYQKTEDGARWYTNLEVGKPMTKAEVSQFKKETSEQEKEERIKNQQNVGRNTWYTEPRVGRTMITSDMQADSEGETELGKEEGTKKQQKVGRNTWYTEPRVGRTMVTSDMQADSEGETELGKEEGIKNQQKVGRNTWYTEPRVGRTMVTSDMQANSEREIEFEDEEETEMQQNVGMKLSKQAAREQQRREKDQRRDMIRRREEEERLYIKEQRERLRREKREVKENAHNQKEVLREKLRELETTGIEAIRRQKDDIMDKLRAQKSYLRELQTKL